MAKFTDGRGDWGGTTGRQVAIKSSHKDGISEVEVHIFTGQSHVLDVQLRQCWVAARAACQEAVENVDEPQSASKGLLLQEVVGIRLPIDVGDTVHLGHSSGLAEVDVGTNGTPGTPFVYNHQTEGLDIGERWVVQRQPDVVRSLETKMFSGTG